MKKFLLLTCFIPVFALSQKFSADRPDEMIKPDPYTSMYFADHNNYKQIESVLTVAKNRYNNFKPDTLNIDYYNKSGFKIKNIRYDNNRISSSTAFKYDKNGNLLSWQSFEKASSTLTLYQYNKKGQLLETHAYIISNKNKKTDTTERSRMLFKYDSDRLVQITNNALGNDIIEKFIYQQNRLVNKNGGYISKEFLYNNDDKLAGINEYMGGVIDSAMIMGIEKITHNSINQLISDSILTTSNLKTNTYQVIEYTYDDRGNMTTMNSRFKNLYRNVAFTYRNGKMEEVYLETNGNSAFLRFIINYRIDEYYTYPIKYLEKFDYDRKGNKISKKVFVNAELFSDISYEITYKK